MLLSHIVQIYLPTSKHRFLDESMEFDVFTSWAMRNVSSSLKAQETAGTFLSMVSRFPHARNCWTCASLCLVPE